jgi:hypothetical protein
MTKVDENKERISKVAVPPLNLTTTTTRQFTVEEFEEYKGVLYQYKTTNDLEGLDQGQ